eukprot:8401096-Alexandrium_andersonii.AAC.1
MPRASCRPRGHVGRPTGPSRGMGTFGVTWTGSSGAGGLGRSPSRRFGGMPPANRLPAGRWRPEIDGATMWRTRLRCGASLLARIGGL